jgi:hypothetical protein
MSNSKEIKTIIPMIPEKPNSTPFQLLEGELVENGGKVLVGLVHSSVYGPMKGFYAIVKPNNPQMLHKYLNAPSEKVLGYKQEELLVKFWEKTKLATNVMVLPMDLIKEHDLQPKEFENTIQLHNHFLEMAKKAVPMAMDPYYYRIGNIK